MKKLFLQTFGWPLFRDCDTFGGLGFGLSGISRGVASLVVCLSLLFSGSAANAEYNYVVLDGKGIENVGVLGDDVSKVEKALGEADQIAEEDMYITDLFYEYHEKGVLVTTDKFKKIKGITLYANTGDKEKFHKTGLMWINPSSIYKTFQGATSRGLKFKDGMTPDDVYAIYGKPEITIPISDKLQSNIQERKPFIIDMGKAGFSINYPEHRMSCTVFGEFVESCTISEDENL